MLNKESLIKIISSALGDIPIDEKSGSENLEDWDSLGHLSILSALDNELNGKAANIDQLASADSFSKIYAILKDNNLAE
jgi:acyl carrier protein